MSIAKQTQKPAEVILVEDASGDDTFEALLKIEVEHKGWVKVIKLDKNSGAASARNRGWEVASQTYIAFLDADDAWHSRKIEIQYAYMAAHPEVVLSGHAHRILTRVSVDLDWIVPEVYAEHLSKWTMLLSNRFVTPSVMLRRDIPMRFAEGRRHMEDHLLWLEIVCSRLGTVRIDMELAAIFKSPFGASGLSAQLWSMELGELSNYRHLYLSGCVGLIMWMGLSLYSLIKFVRRLIIYWGYMKWKN